MKSTSIDKVPPAHAFHDLSDYARPLGRWLVRRLAPTPVTPNHVTLAFTVVGFMAAGLLMVQRWLWLAGGLLLLKSALDAADGALARARSRPSRVGRFLDSVCDFAVNLALYAGLAIGAWQATGQAAYLVLGPLALISALLQVSLFNHYYVRYRHHTGGDQTSRTDEAGPQGYLWDDPVWLERLYSAYRLIYGWQDALVAHLDQAANPRQAPPSARFMTAASLLGLGTQLLVIAACAVAGRPTLALWLFPTVFNLYAVALIVTRARDSA